jgi:hypothetical protein
MTRSIFGVVLGGVIVGVLAFFVPHLLIGIFVLMLIIRVLHCGMGHGCHGRGRHMGKLLYMADLVRKMNDEEYAEFKEKMGGGCCGNGHYSHVCGCGCGCKTESKECCDTKKEETK